MILNNIGKISSIPINTNTVNTIYIYICNNIFSFGTEITLNSPSYDTVYQMEDMTTSGGEHIYKQVSMLGISEEFHNMLSSFYESICGKLFGDYVSDVNNIYMNKL